MKTFYSVIAGILAFVLFVPTVVSNDLLFPFISGKNFIFRLLVLCVCLLFAWAIFKYRKITPVNNPPHIIFGFFVGVVLLADLFGVNPTRSIFGNFERMEGWFTLGLLYLLFILLYQIYNSIFIWRTVFKISLVSNIYIILFTLDQYWGGREISQYADTLRPDATLGNSSYLGGYALMYIFILAWLTLTSKNIFSKVAYSVLILVNIYVMAITLTRGALVGFAVAIGSIVVMASVVYLFKKIKKQVMPRFLFLAPLAVGLCIVGVITFVLNRDSSFVQNYRPLQRLATISLEDTSVRARVINWSVSWDGFKERPILGWGQENFLYVFSAHFDPRMGAYEAWYDRSHNIFLDWLIAAGALGLIGYLGLYIVSLWMLWVRPNARTVFSLTESILWTGFFVAYFVHNFFVFDNIASYILFVFVLAYITWKSYASGKNETRELSKKHSTIVAVFFAFIGIFGIYFTVYRPWIGGLHLAQAIQYTEVALITESDTQAQVWSKEEIGIAYTKRELISFARERFQQAAQYPLGRTEAREQLAQKLRSVLENKTISNNEKVEWIRLVMLELEDEIKRDPNNARIYQLTAGVLLQIGKAKEAIVFFEKAQALSPKKQLIMLDTAIAYQLLGDYDKALEISKQAFDLDQTFVGAKTRYALSLYRVGRDDEAQELDVELVKDMVKRDSNPTLRTIYENQVKLARVDYRVRMAVSAYDKGDMATYNRYIREISDIDPSAVVRLREIIKESQG
ncbi:MAG: O-antigen ligase family protein [Minisyncoccia bacterium]